MVLKTPRHCQAPTLASSVLLEHSLGGEPQNNQLVPNSASAVPPGCPLCRIFWDCPGPCPLQLQLSHYKAPQDPWHVPHLGSGCLARVPFVQRAPRCPACTHFSFNCPGREPSVQKVPGLSQPMPISVLVIPPGQHQHRVPRSPSTCQPQLQSANKSPNTQSTEGMTVPKTISSSLEVAVPPNS